MDTYRSALSIVNENDYNSLSKLLKKYFKSRMDKLFDLILGRHFLESEIEEEYINKKEKKQIKKEITQYNKKIKRFELDFKPIIKIYKRLLDSGREHSKFQEANKSIKKLIKYFGHKFHEERYDHVYEIPREYIDVVRAIQKGVKSKEYNYIPNNAIEVKISIIGDDYKNITRTIFFATIPIEILTKRWGDSIPKKAYKFIHDSINTIASYAIRYYKYTNMRYAYNFYNRPFIGKRKKEIQFYKHGLTNCLLTPIKNYFIQKIPNVSKSTKTQYNLKIKDIDNFMTIYKNGVPEDKIQEICDKLYCTIEIYDIFNNISISYEGKNSRKIFKLINTKFNHVDEYKNIDDFEIIKLESYIKMMKMYDELINKKINFLYYENTFGIHKIQTNDKIYEIDDKFKDTVSQFSKDIDIYKICGIDYINEQKLSTYLDAGCHISGCVDYVKNIEEYKKFKLGPSHIAGSIDYIISANSEGYKDEESILIRDLDHEKSYTQFKTCKYYKGFMPKPSDVFRKIDISREENKTFLNTVIGIFTIDQIDSSNVDMNIKKHIKKLNIYGINSSTEQITLPCVELLFMLDLGFTFNIICGCFSHIDNSFDFEFTDIMKNSKIKFFKKGKEFSGPSYYAVWSGTLGHKSEYKHVYCNIQDKRLLNTVLNNYDFGEFYNLGNGEARLNIKKIKSKYCPQVLAYITSYARINVLNQLFEFDYKNIIRVVADAFYFKGEIPKLHDKFRNKDNGIIKNNVACDTYFNSCFVIKGDYKTNEEDKYITYKELIPLPKHNNTQEHIYKHKILLKIGCGGGGKTYSALSDKGYNNVCYVAPSHKLLRAKANEFTNIKLCTLSKLTGGKLKSNTKEEILIFLKKNKINDKYVDINNFKYLDLKSDKAYKKALSEEKKNKNKKNKINNEFKKNDKGSCLTLYNKYSPAVIICDEITQYTEDQKKYIINTYKYSKIIFCGDISVDGKIMYQLPCISGTPFRIDNIQCIEQYNKNKRCKCDKLKNRLIGLRKAIKDGIPCDELIKILFKQNKFNFVTNENMNYDINDYILCSKRRCNKCSKADCDCDGNNYTNFWTKKYENKFDKKKFLMTQNIDGLCNGDVIISDEKPRGAIPRHAFTCHQIQGETIKNSKIFIDSRNLFDVSMLYTAVSRAEYYDQIYIIYDKIKEVLPIQKEEKKINKKIILRFI